MQKIFIVATLFFVAATIVGCTGNNGGRSGSASGKIFIVSTTAQIGDAVSHVGAEFVESMSLMGPGIDPHTYKPTHGDVERLTGADIIFYNGNHLEGKMGDIFEQMSGSKPTVAVADGIPEELYITNVSFPGAHDPHIWFDVDLWVMVVQYVAESLAEFDPDHTDEYFANAEAYESELHELDTYVTNRALELDDSSRVLITAHDAFGYFGQAYSFEVRGLQGISTATEAGTADVSSLADFITERQIPAIFVESSVSPRTIEAVQAAVESRGYNVEIGGQLFSDAMGEPGTFEGTYIGMVTYNIDTIVDSLSR